MRKPKPSGWAWTLSRYQILCVGQRIVIFFQANDSAFTSEFPQGVDNPLKFVAPKSRAFLYFDRRQSRSRLFGEEIENSLLRASWGGSCGLGILAHGRSSSYSFVKGFAAARCWSPGVMD